MVQLWDSTIFAGSRTFKCSFAILDAAVVPPVGRWKILLDFMLVSLKGSFSLPAVEVAPVSLTPDGMLPSSIPFFICSSSRRARLLLFMLEFSCGRRVVAFWSCCSSCILLSSRHCHAHPLVSQCFGASVNVTLCFVLSLSGDCVVVV